MFVIVWLVVCMGHILRCHCQLIALFNVFNKAVVRFAELRMEIRLKKIRRAQISQG